VVDRQSLPTAFFSGASKAIGEARCLQLVVRIRGNTGIGLIRGPALGDFELLRPLYDLWSIELHPGYKRTIRAFRRWLSGIGSDNQAAFLRHLFGGRMTTAVSSREAIKARPQLIHSETAASP
jgi:hypothetical protein